MENDIGLSPLAELHLCNTPTQAKPLLGRKLSWSAESASSTPRRNKDIFARSSPPKRMKLSARSNLFRRLNSAPSPMSASLADRCGKENELVHSKNSQNAADAAAKENTFLLQRSPTCSRHPLEDCDTNSQDSGFSAEISNDIRFAVPNGFAPRKGIEPSPGKSWLAEDSTSPGSRPARSPGSFKAKSMRSLSFCSTDSFDDGFSDFGDVERLDENAPLGFSSLLKGELKTTEACDDPPTPIKRLPIRRAFSMVENTLSPISSPSGSTNVEKGSKRSGEFPPPGLLKRRKETLENDPPRHKLQRSASENCATLLSSALNNVYGRPELIADFSRPYALPVVPGKHSDLTSITPDTLAAVIRGDYSSTLKSFTIIDCRYPYEFEGGHIRGATNLYTPEQVEAEFLNAPTESRGSERNILIFHCEFSVARGPSMYRWLRRRDRHSSHYPSLQYPEVYLLHGGYQSFYQSHPNLCDPIGYTPMQDPNYESDLRKYRIKSSSWSHSRGSFKRLHLM